MTRSVLIQDNDNNCAYLIKSNEKDQYVYDNNTVIFFMGPFENEDNGGSSVNKKNDLSVIIQDLDDGKVYAFSNEILQKYRIDLPRNWDELPLDTVAFVLPSSDGIEELPTQRRALLQSNTPRCPTADC